MRQIIEEERKVQPNLILEPYETAKILENYYCIKLGYVDRDLKAGDKLYIRPDEMIVLYKILKIEVEK